MLQDSLEYCVQVISAFKPGGLLLSVPARLTGSTLRFDLIQKVSKEIKAAIKIAKIQSVPLKIHKLPLVRQHGFLNRFTD